MYMLCCCIAAQYTPVINTNYYKTYVNHIVISPQGIPVHLHFCTSCMYGLTSATDSFNSCTCVYIVITEARCQLYMLSYRIRYSHNISLTDGHSNDSHTMYYDNDSHTMYYDTRRKTYIDGTLPNIIH